MKVKKKSKDLANYFWCFNSDFTLYFNGYDDWLATPLAIVVSEGLCAKSGILVKKSETLELASKSKVVVFDKTGTLTYGKLKISQIINKSEFSNKELLQLACSIESKSTHPISTAFMDKVKSENIELLEVNGFENMSGFGLVGIVQKKLNKHLVK